MANTASGKTYAGAVRRGHLYVYVVIGKKGSLRSWNDRRPFEAYAVEGYLLKAGKHTRGTYLAWATKVSVRFAKRLQVHWSVSGDQ